MHDALRRLRELQNWRQRPPRDPHIKPLLDDTRRRARKSEKTFAAIAEAWMNCVPDELRDHTALAGFRSGTLHVRVDSAAVHYRLESMLRSGLLHELREQLPVALNRVRIAVGTLDD